MGTENREQKTAENGTQGGGEGWQDVGRPRGKKKNRRLTFGGGGGGGTSRVYEWKGCAKNPRVRGVPGKKLKKVIVHTKGAGGGMFARGEEAKYVRRFPQRGRQDGGRAGKGTASLYTAQRFSVGKIEERWGYLFKGWGVEPLRFRGEKLAFKGRESELWGLKCNAFNTEKNDLGEKGDVVF